ncbi:hypothetical protein CBS76997_6667 [Aspergillus niger]|uniref:Uncharacterized protein n=2 Tax=Aspergillus niger TaxID=5061 RepID=G3XXV2_ASPNA|nr:hypothetical protein ASPNIDRAFT_40482 [Aspergillus niger ATCC 1015]KAI2832173.1 hypothetical protein CBS133816_1657 [Aspergillus niger]KAI2890466.1 hypothetical protein CBS13152_5549 [Aspergillus niger]KAI2956888.1 hypothetical protein CBS147322_2501 [Aspergillus niger]KAI2962624.1 hypothetical protein CBS147323_7311 [Aspergillus niger]
MAPDPFSRQHPDEIHTPSWHAASNRPIVDGKYNDPETGEVRNATGFEFSGPPAVDVIITNLHEDSSTSVRRVQLPFRVEALLVWIMRIVDERKLQIDSLNATPYAIRVVLAHELSGEEFAEVADVMATGIWNYRQ